MFLVRRVQFNHLLEADISCVIVHIKCIMIEPFKGKRALKLYYSFMVFTCLFVITKVTFS